jgi:hypothetical protein
MSIVLFVSELDGSTDSTECWPNNIRSVPLPTRKIFIYLPPVTDALGLRTPGIHSIPCECGRVYIGQSGPDSYTMNDVHSS